MDATTPLRWGIMGTGDIAGAEMERSVAAGITESPLRPPAGAIPEALHEIGRMVVDDLEAAISGRDPTRLQYATPEMITRLRA